MTTLGRHCLKAVSTICANKEKSDVIGWKQTKTTSPANHAITQSHSLFACSREKNRQAENGFIFYSEFFI
jgi:hypothetical protein